MSDRIPMSWDDYEALPPSLRSRRVHRRGARDVARPAQAPSAHLVPARPAPRGRPAGGRTAIPHLAVEVLSLDPARDIVRKAAKLAWSGTGSSTPTGPEVIVYRLADGVLVEQAGHGAGHVAVLDTGPATVAFDPTDLVASRRPGRPR